MTTGFDVERVRADFPILKTTVHGKPLVFLDSAASAQKPRAVIDAMNELYTRSYANIHRGVYELSLRATQAFERGDLRQSVSLAREGSTLGAPFLADLPAFPGLTGIEKRQRSFGHRHISSRAPMGASRSIGKSVRTKGVSTLKSAT